MENSPWNHQQNAQSALETIGGEAWLNWVMSHVTCKNVLCHIHNESCQHENALSVLATIGGEAWLNWVMSHVTRTQIHCGTSLQSWLLRIFYVGTAYLECTARNKRDPSLWKETYKRDLSLWNETYERERFLRWQCVSWGSLKLQVSFTEYRLFYRALLQKRPILSRSLLIVATPYNLSNVSPLFNSLYTLNKQMTLEKAHLKEHFIHLKEPR